MTDTTDKALDALVARYRQVASTMRRMKAATIEAYEMDAGADAITCLRAQLATARADAVRVKPLVWEDGKFRSGSPRETSDSVLGTYEILQWASGDFGGSVPADDPDQSGTEFGEAVSLDEAKAACQADYTRRILALIETPTPSAPSPEAVARAALEVPEVAAAVDALQRLHHAVCGETGFAECVRRDSGKVYPWPALSEADLKSRRALATLASIIAKAGEGE
jgi:hypothetical protein